MRDIIVHILNHKIQNLVEEVSILASIPDYMHCIVWLYPYYYRRNLDTCMESR